MRCDLVHIEQVPLGECALRLFVADAELTASIIEHRCDGRLVLSDAPKPGLDGIVPTITLLLQRRPDHLYVVLEQDAYWPETFPKLHGA
ncbi:hypothetical protein DEVEQU_02139 [Devosia equisanguinis]|uniref:Uncharacterized protein n=1 Tax=Devosia equisanguinis TaxID=2490941 RepID=A0A447IBX1_9HYPH|nr:hypothetical protein [Devosia equisanguinis]VDS04998.1 hypothetical protein DEVEQU_02139 [Devosia equisanguinis]